MTAICHIYSELIPSGIINGEKINICPGEGYSLDEIIAILRSEVGQSIKVEYHPQRDYDVQHFVGETNRRKAILGDRKFIDFASGLKMTIELYRREIERSTDGLFNEIPRR